MRNPAAGKFGVKAPERKAWEVPCNKEAQGNTEIHTEIHSARAGDSHTLSLQYSKDRLLGRVFLMDQACFKPSLTGFKICSQAFSTLSS